MVIALCALCAFYGLSRLRVMRVSALARWRVMRVSELAR